MNIIFNNISFVDLGWTVADIQRSATPTLSHNTYATSGIAGSAFRSRTVGERQISITFHRVANNTIELQEKIREMVNVLDVTEPKPLIMSDLAGYYINAIPAGTVDIDQTRSYAQITVDFVCHDPYFYRNEPVVFGSVSTATFTRNWTGAREQYWLMTITVKSATTNIPISCGKTKITLNGNFVANDVITIDTDEIVRLNGEYAPHLLSFDSRIYPLTPGANAGTGPTTISHKMAVTNKRLY